jgi:tellurite resistance protein TerB
MALWNQIRNQAQSVQTAAMAKAKDFKSGAFRDSTMAMCALIAAADGSVDAEERRKVAALISQNEVLKNFPADQLQQIFNDNVDKLMRDFDFGKVSILQEIAKVRKKEDEARAVIQIGIIIGSADGKFDEDEKKVVREACHSLGLSPAEFEL